jgi:iron-sulfur cluster repair protein YtfE (RIC family)
LLQELIDVAVILNSLRALTSGDDSLHLSARDTAVTARFRSQHTSLRTSIEEIRRVADSLGSMESAETLHAVETIYEMLIRDIQPHEEEEEAILYPLLERLVGGREPLGAMSRAHREIAHQIRRLGQVIGELHADHIDEAEIMELRGLLYGLYFIVKLHTAQEDENYLYLDDSQILA